MCLKEQEGIFHGEEIKAGLGRGRQGASGTGNGMCKATGERENLARLPSSTSKRLTPRSVREGRAGHSPGMLEWRGHPGVSVERPLHISPSCLDFIYSTVGSQGRLLAGE